MKRLWLVAILSFTALSTAVQAVLANVELAPGRPDNSLNFDIHSERLRPGEIQFTVKISEKPPPSRRRLTPWLGTMKIVDYPMDGRSSSLITGSRENQIIRRLSFEWDGNVLKCTFSVTENELKNPDLSFFVSVASESLFPSGTNFFARLKNFLKP